jgi:hypothetical protein
MKTYKARIKGISPYSQSKHYDAPKLEKEGAEDYDKRTWRNRMHVDDRGEVFIPPMAVKNCLSEAAKFLSKQIPGKGKATYTKHFEAGIMVMDPVSLGMRADEVKEEALFVPASGRRGDGKRVTRRFPYIPEGWEGDVVIHVVDETVTGDVLREHLEEAGKLIGMGRFRPRNNGYYGRFRLVNLEEVA